MAIVIGGHNGYFHWLVGHSPCCYVCVVRWEWVVWVRGYIVKEINSLLMSCSWAEGCQLGVQPFCHDASKSLRSRYSLCTLPPHTIAQVLFQEWFTTNGWTARAGMTWCEVKIGIVACFLCVHISLYTVCATAIDWFCACPAHYGVCLSWAWSLFFAEGHARRLLTVLSFSCSTYKTTPVGVSACPCSRSLCRGINTWRSKLRGRWNWVSVFTGLESAVPRKSGWK